MSHHNVILVNGKNFNPFVLSNIDTLFMKMKNYIIIMSEDSDPLNYIPESIDNIMFLSSKFDYSEAFKGTIDMIEANENDTISVIPSFYFFNKKVILEAKNIIDKSQFYTLKIISDETDKEAIDFNRDNLNLLLNNRIYYLSKENNRHKEIDKVPFTSVKHFKSTIKKNSQIRIPNLSSLISLLKENNRPQYESNKYFGLFLDNKIVDFNIKSVHELTSEEEKKDTIRNTPKPKINNDTQLLNSNILRGVLTNGKINICIKFEDTPKSLPRFSLNSEIWETVFKLFDNSRKYNVLVMGAYPFKKRIFEVTNNIYNLETIVDNKINNDDILRSCDLVFSKNVDFLKHCVTLGIPVVSYCSELDYNKIYDLKNLKGQIKKRENPIVPPVELYELIHNYIKKIGIL